MSAKIRRSSDRRRILVASLVFLAVMLVSGISLHAQPLPKVTLGVDKASKPGDVAVTLQILLLFTILSLAPAIMIMTTSFTRIVIVLHFVRQALGLQNMPPNQLIIGLSLFLTFFVMHPALKRVNDEALQPYLKETITQKQAFDKGIAPLREFMLRQTREKDLALFVKFARMEQPQTPTQIPTHVLIPAFVISELRIAFQIGFLLYIPFLMIDLIVSSVLMSMGMLMLPPVMVSLPFKVLLFVLVDGWYLVVSSLLMSFK